MILSKGGNLTFAHLLVIVQWSGAFLKRLKTGNGTITIRRMSQNVNIRWEWEEFKHITGHAMYFWHLNIPSISLYVLQAQSCPFSALFFLYFLCCIILNPESSISSPRLRVVPSLYPVYVSTNFSTVGEWKSVLTKISRKKDCLATFWSKEF